MTDKDPYWSPGSMPEHRKKEIAQLLRDATAKLKQAEVLSEGYPSYQDAFDFDVLGYGAGATLRDGLWRPSSQSC